jgi:hypothetical protein
MRKHPLQIGLVVLCAYFCLCAAIEWSGYLQIDNRIRTKDWSYSSQEYRLSLQTDYKPNDNIHFSSELWLRSIGFPDIKTSNDLRNNQKITPAALDLREAYVDLYGLVNRNLDLRIGRQRIAWGVADKLNPTDNLNPNDLEDILDFGRHLASNGIKASYYIKDLSLSGVFIPVSTPAVLPQGDWANAFTPTISLAQGFSYRNITDTIIMPDHTLKQSSIYGARLAGSLLNYDFSLSYVYTRYDLPILNRMTFIPTSNPPEVDLQYQLVFPRTNIIGFDLAGAIKDIGIWAEAAMYLPEKTTLTTDLSLLGMGTQDTILLEKPYLRYIIGLDYTFKNGIYINGQYLRGFVHERGNENLEDYFTFAMEWKFLQDKIKLSPLNSAIEIKNWQDIKHNYAVALSPEISYNPFSGAELSIGFRWLQGSNTTTFGRAQDNDELYLKVKYCF